MGVTRREGDRRADIETMEKSMKERRDGDSTSKTEGG